jgi:hypothetical protein
MSRLRADRSGMSQCSQVRNSFAPGEPGTTRPSATSACGWLPALETHEDAGLDSAGSAGYSRLACRWITPRTDSCHYRGGTPAVAPAEPGRGAGLCLRSPQRAILSNTSGPITSDVVKARQAMNAGHALHPT